MNVTEQIKLNPIGFVKKKTTSTSVKNERNVSEIVLRDDLIEGVEGIEDFSHLWVIFWMHEILKNSTTKKVHPRGRRDMPLLGIFATRTPYRPNPIGLTLVELLNVNRNVLSVRGLDALDGTPILDIKPFDHWDTAQDVIVPTWWRQLENERDKRILKNLKKGRSR